MIQIMNVLLFIQLLNITQLNVSSKKYQNCCIIRYK